MILLDERQEVLMLVTNSIKMDMNHKNPYIAGLSLAALGNICSAEMARDLAPDLERLVEHGSPYLRKKAALCASRWAARARGCMWGMPRWPRAHERFRLGNTASAPCCAGS